MLKEIYSFEVSSNMAVLKKVQVSKNHMTVVHAECQVSSDPDLSNEVLFDLLEDFFTVAGELAVLA